MRTLQTKQKSQVGFSTLELSILLAMSLIIFAIAVPTYTRVASYMRSLWDLRSLNGITAQAKMRAAADFTHARAYLDLNSNSFHLEVWDKINNCWHTDGDAVNNCTAGNSPTTSLSRGITVAFGTSSVGPTPGTGAVAQAPLCRRRVAGINGGGADQNSACIEFNSRGIPVDATNAPVATGAFYLTDGNTVEAVTVSATGSIQSWVSSAACIGQTCWHAQ